MVLRDSVARYFMRVYPALRGAGGNRPVTALGRRVTEPGQEDRLAWVLRELAESRPQRILDAGCGTGIYAVALAGLGHRVTALDLSPSMLSATRERAEAAGVSERIELVEADLRGWEPRARYDTVICMGVLEYYLGPEQLLERLYSWTRGQLLLSVSGARRDVRALVRSAWLATHGVSARGFRPAELERMISHLPGASGSVREMRWAHCVSAKRGNPWLESAGQLSSTDEPLSHCSA